MYANPIILVSFLIRGNYQHFEGDVQLYLDVNLNGNKIG